MNRARDLDGLRFIAAVTVILRHTGEYPELPDGWGGLIRVSVRWCVPFFFLVFGYCLCEPEQADGEGAGRGGTDRGGPAIPLERVARIARMFAVASLLYLPLMIAKGATPISEIGPALLLTGTWYHLWFLSALCLALVVIAAVSQAPGGGRLLDLAAGIILAAFVALDVAMSLDGSYGGALDLARQAQGIALVWLGYRLARARVRPAGPAIAALVLGGVALTFLDVFVLERFGGHMSWRQCSPGAILVAVGLLLWGVKGTIRLPEWMVWMGRKHAFAIYILHPLFVAAAGVAVAGLTGGARPSLAIAALALLATLAVAEALRRYLPSARAVMDGRLPDRTGARPAGEGRAAGRAEGQAAASAGV